MKFLLVPVIIFISSCGGGEGGKDKAKPSPSVVYAWVSNVSTTGNIGGVAGANSHCVSTAGSIGFSTSVTNHKAGLFIGEPRNYIANNPSLKRPDGTLIANRYSDFWDTSVSNIVAGVTTTVESIFIGTLTYGVADCQRWTVAHGNANTGHADKTDARRYNANSFSNCSDSHRLLCISY